MECCGFKLIMLVSAKASLSAGCCFDQDQIRTEVFKLLFFCLKSSVKCYSTLKMKRYHPFTMTNQSWGAHAVTNEFSVFQFSGKRRYFSCFPFSMTLCSKVTIRKYKAYWHMNFSLINACGTRKNNIRSHSFCLSDTCEFTIIIIVAKKSEQV